jgi:hypothetical protein
MHKNTKYNKIIFDIVYTWVDFSNLKWKNDYNKYYNKINNTNNYNIMNRSNSNLEELKYSLRSIEKHLKVNIGKIYVVSNYGSVPDFLSDNKKVVIVDYLLLLKKKTFNSQAIESVLHKIPNLREYFLYFNDDFMLGSDIYVNDLVDDDGKLIWYCENNFFIKLHNKFPNIDLLLKLDSGVSSSRNYTYDIIMKKNKIKNMVFQPISHCVRIFKKSMVKKFIYIYKNHIKKMRKNIFRNNEIFCFIDGFYAHYLIHEELKFINTKKTLTLVQHDYNAKNIILYYYNFINIYYAVNFHFLCVEDIRKNSINVDINIKSFLEKLFNLKSRYEK